MIPDLVIFDCDGVLVDTEPVTDRIIAANLTRHGLPIQPQEIHTLFAGGTLKLVGEEAARRGAVLPPDWLEAAYEEVYAGLRAGVDVVPGVLNLIDRLETAGIATAIASNGPMQKMQISLAASGLLQRFDVRIHSAYDHAPKPAPDLLLHAMKVAGADPARTWMVDDMPAGWRAAQAAGCGCFAYVAEGGPARAAEYAVTPVTDMAQIAVALGV
ncbi:HAD family hydrolase [Loktanella sp. DJP18]|uniref:HAD family hydrolase n=1 Tax=Loktanella sp. DJP18 TaxID=3409788 RepID=UPI003BB4F206